MKNVTVAGVNFATEQDGAISHIYARELRRMLEAEGHIQVSVFAEAEMLRQHRLHTGAKETGGEVDFLKRMAKQHGWRNVIYLYQKPHNRRIGRLLRSRGFHIAKDTHDIDGNTITIFPQSSETVIKRYDPLYWQAVNWSDIEKSDKAFALSEMPKNALMDLVDHRGTAPTWLAHHVTHESKERLQTIFYGLRPTPK